MINAKDLEKVKANDERVKTLLKYIENRIVSTNLTGNNQITVRAAVCCSTLNGIRDWYYQFANDWDLTMSIPDIDKAIEELKNNNYSVDVDIWRNGYGRPNEYKIKITW